MKPVLTMSSSISDIEFGEECLACDDDCATCFIQPNYCLSCGEDRKLNGTNCIHRRVISFVYVLNTNYAEFLENGGL